jgi:hypothetical protein
MPNPASGRPFDNNLLAEAIADAKAVRQTALANARRELDATLGPYLANRMFEADIGYPPELHQLLFEKQNPWDWPKLRKNKITPVIYLRAAVEAFKKCMPAERRVAIGEVVYKFQLKEFSLIEKNKSSVNSWEDYSFIPRVKVVPHRDCIDFMRYDYESGKIRFWFKGDIDIDDNDEVCDIKLTDISLKATIKANP